MDMDFDYNEQLLDDYMQEQERRDDSDIDCASIAYGWLMGYKSEKQAISDLVEIDRYKYGLIYWAEQVCEYETRER